MTILQEGHVVVDGKLTAAEGSATYEVINPATEEVIGTAPDASANDVRGAIAAARTAFDTTDWSTNLALRVRVLRQLRAALEANHDDLADTLVAEVGAPRMLTGGPQLATPRELLTYYANLAEAYEWQTPLGTVDTLTGPAERVVEREAVGVVAAITPWNYPVQIALAKVAPALAAGCTVVLKPAPDTPWTSLAIGRLALEHTDIPPGVLNVVTSSVKEIGEVMTTSPDVDLVSFTGSTAVGRHIMAAAASTVKRVFLELGGKSAHIVVDDVDDMANAVAPAAFQVCTHGGQGCATTSRLLLPRSRYEEGVQAIAALVSALPWGDPDDPGNMTGPIINRAQLDRIEGYVQQGVAQGGRIVCGGTRGTRSARGLWFEPTVIADVTNDMTVAQEEIFGPVIVAIAYDDDDDAVRIANDSIFGLSGAVFGKDIDRAMAIARRLRTGTVGVNGALWYAPDVPFGGYKQSGVGREMGVAGLEEYLQQKAIARPPTQR